VAVGKPPAQSLTASSASSIEFPNPIGMARASRRAGQGKSSGHAWDRLSQEGLRDSRTNAPRSIGKRFAGCIRMRLIDWKSCRASGRRGHGGTAERAPASAAQSMRIEKTGVGMGSGSGVGLLARALEGSRPTSYYPLPTSQYKETKMIFLRYLLCSRESGCWWARRRFLGGSLSDFPNRGELAGEAPSPEIGGGGKRFAMLAILPIADRDEYPRWFPAVGGRR